MILRSEELRYRWSQTSGAEVLGVALSDASSRITSFVIPTGLSSATEIAFALRVTDERGAATTDDLVVYVELGVNTPPVVDAGSDQVVGRRRRGYVARQCDGHRGWPSVV